MGCACGGAGRAAGDLARRSHLGFWRDGEGGIKQRVLLFFFFNIFLTPARAVHQPTRSCSVPVPTPSAHCRAGCPPGPRGRGLGRGCWYPTIKNNDPALCCSGSGCLCLEDDEPSPNLGYLGMWKRRPGEGRWLCRECCRVGRQDTVRWAPSTFPTGLGVSRPEGLPGFGEEEGVRRSPSPNLHRQL